MDRTEGKTQLKSPQKTRRIEELDHELASLSEEKDLLYSQANELAEKRNRLNEKSRDLRNEIQCVRSERDQLNENVRELKQRRNDLTAKIKEKIEEIRELRQQHEGWAKKRPRRSHQDLQEEIDSVEWKIQTTPHTLQEDKDLVEKVKKLQVQLNVHKKLEQSEKTMLRFQEEVRSLKSESEHCHQALTAQAQKSQERHARMLEKIEEAKTTKAEADSLHKQFLDTKGKARPVEEQTTNVINEMRQLKKEIREEEQKEKKQSDDELRQTLEKEAREKLKRGGKLSWQEFQLLSEKGVTAQD